MGCTQTVMVVDDDVDLRGSLADALNDEGYAVEETGNGREALAALRHHERPCVILLDLTMPVMDGYAFRAEQRRDPSLSSIPVIVITADAKVRVPDVAPAKVLVKPVDLSRLLDAVREFC